MYGFGLIEYMQIYFHTSSCMMIDRRLERTNNDGYKHEIEKNDIHRSTSSIISFPSIPILFLSITSCDDIYFKSCICWTQKPMGYKYSEADHEWHTIQYNTTVNIQSTYKTHAHTFLLGKKIPIHRPELTCYYVYILFVLVVIIHIYISVSDDIWTNLNKGIGYSSKRDDQKTKKKPRSYKLPCFGF